MYYFISIVVTIIVAIQFAKNKKKKTRIEITDSIVIQKILDWLETQYTLSDDLYCILQNGKLKLYPKKGEFYVKYTDDIIIIKIENNCIELSSSGILVMENFITNILSNSEKIQVYCNEKSDSWYLENELLKRSPDSLVLKQGIREGITSDLSKFYCNRNWYTGIGVPYRRGYLFSGLPGTGKTSFIQVLAGIYSKPIYKINLEYIQESPRLISRVPSDAIIVIEDVTSTQIELYSKYLIEIFDRLQDGHVIILTTNDTSKLGPIARKGRCDVHEKFGYADKDQCMQIYLKIFTDADKDEAKSVSEKIMDKSLAATPADLQEFFMSKDCVSDDDIKKFKNSLKK